VGLPRLLVVACHSVRLNNEESSASDVLDAPQISCLRNLGDPKRSPVSAPEVLFVFSADKAFQIQTLDYIAGLSEIEGREWNFYGRGPSVGSDARLGRPYTVPPPVEVGSVCVSLLLHDKTVVLGTKGMDLEYIGSTAIVVRIDQDFEVVVQVLAYVAAELRRDNPGRLRVVGMNPEIRGMPRVENAYFCLLRWRLAFVRFSLTELGNGFGGLPERVVQGSVEPWGVVNTGCLRTHPSGLALRGWSCGVRARQLK
jgi:hypothetical protein